mgnify:CR=1 FL=1
MNSRRRFIGQVATGLAGTIASPVSVLGANSRIRLGIIGPGDRGMQLMREAARCRGVEFAGVADVYTRRLEAAKELAPAARTYTDYRGLLDDQSIDAVIIATPQHLHAEHFVAALDAGKHVYQEKTMAFTLEHAKRMRAAFQRARRVVQVGHQACSSGQIVDATAYATAANLGKVTAINAFMYRNTPRGKPQWSRPVFPDMTPENIAWNAFLGEAPKVPFDANRYINWRFFWDYSGGNFYENMCHQLAFWYKALNLEIPGAVTTRGGIYVWKDGREVPDTMSVAMEHREELLFSWISGFGNNQPGVSEDVLGTDGTLSNTKGGIIRYEPQKVNRPQAAEMVGRTRVANPTLAHLENFFGCIRTGKEPNCPFELGYRVSIAARMAVDSYRGGRTLKWNAETEEIV